MPGDHERWNLDGAGGIFAYRASRWVRIGSYEIEFYNDQFGMQMRIAPSLEIPSDMTVTVTYDAISQGVAPRMQSWHIPVPLWDSTGRVREIYHPVRQPAHRVLQTKWTKAERVGWELAKDVLPPEICATLERGEEVRLPSSLYTWCQREYRFTYRSVKVCVYEADRWVANLCVQPGGGYLPKSDWCVFQYMHITLNEQEWLSRANVVMCVRAGWRKMPNRGREVNS